MELPNLTESSPSNPPGLNRYITRKNVAQAYEILPGLRSTSASFFRLNHKLAVALTAVLPPSRRDGALLEAPGVSENWSRLYNVMGVPHNPEGVPPFDASGYQAALTAATGLPSDAITSDLSLASSERCRRLAKLFIGRGRMRSVHVKNAVVTGLPGMTSDLVEKQKIIRMWLDHYREIARLIDVGDLRTLAARFGIVFAYFTGRRYQPDAVVHTSRGSVWTPSATVPPDVVASGKPRPVCDWEGRWVVGDKALSAKLLEENGAQLFLACRSRKINAAPFAATFPLRIAAGECEAFFDDEYPETMYHTGLLDIQSKLEGATELFIVDVANHDVNMPKKVRDILVERAIQVFGPFIGRLLAMTFRMPQLVRNDYAGGSGVRLQGDPYDRATFVANYVNPSGHPWTSILAKFAGVFFMYDALCELGVLSESEEDLHDFLKGRKEVKVLNAGDNMAVRGLKGGLEALQSASPYCRYTEATSFQGNVVVKSGSSHVVRPNINSYVFNFFVPGRPIGHQQRGHWANGHIERQEVFVSALGYDDAHNAVNEVTKDELGETLDDMARRSLVHHDFVSVSLVDREFMLDQDIVHYKRHFEDITKEVFERYYLTVPPSVYSTMYEALLSYGK